jgi:hypothetical protein
VVGVTMLSIGEFAALTGLSPKLLRRAKLPAQRDPSP